jgi:hypothetical protein
VQRWLQLAVGLVLGGVLGILARAVLRMVYDTAVNTAAFDARVLVAGTLVVTVAFLLAAAISTPVATGAALTSTASVIASWLGLRLIDAQPSVGTGIGFMADELRWALSTGYYDVGAVVLSGAFIAIAVERARRGLVRRQPRVEDGRPTA